MIVTVNGLIKGEPGRLHKFFGADPVKFQPRVFPWLIFVRSIGVNLAGTDQKALVFLYVINMCVSLRVGRV